MSFYQYGTRYDDNMDCRDGDGGWENFCWDGNEIMMMEWRCQKSMGIGVMEMVKIDGDGKCLFYHVTF